MRQPKYNEMTPEKLLVIEGLAREGAKVYEIGPGVVKSEHVGGFGGVQGIDAPGSATRGEGYFC